MPILHPATSENFFNKSVRNTGHLGKEEFVWFGMYVIMHVLEF